MFRNTLTVCALMVLAFPASAQLVQVTDPALLNATTTANFTDSVGSVYVFGQPVPNTAGDLIEFRAGGEVLRRVDQGNGFLGTFADGTPLLFAQSVLDGGGNVVTEGGPITFSFPNPVFAFGVLAQTETVGPEEYTLTAFSGASQVSSFTVNLDSTLSVIDPAFLGFRTEGVLVDRVVLSTNLNNSFVIGAPSFSAVPEPGTVALLGGMVALGGLMLRRRVRK